MENKTFLPSVKKFDKNIGNKLQDFTILQILGEGGFGSVAKVKSKIDLKIYALKKFNLGNDDEKLLKKFKNEILFSQYFNHKNVCKCLSAFEENGCYYFVMDFFNNKDLHKYLVGYIFLNVNIPEEKLWDIFYQCLEGLTYIHNMGVIHKDIKIANLLMTDKGKIFIGDFGISEVISKEEAYKFTKNEEEINSLLIDPDNPGTDYYMAPEIQAKKNYDQKVDVFSMGICFYVLCFKTFPYLNGQYMLELVSDNIYSDELKEIIKLMININQYERPTSFEIFQLFKKYYTKKYMKNSGIYSAVRCLFNFPNFELCFRDQNKISQIIDNKYNKNITPVFIAIGTLLSENKNLDEEIYNLRKNLYDEGLKIEDNKEIFPQLAIRIIINSLNYELNKLPPLPPKKVKEDNNNENDEKEEDEEDEEKKFDKFIEDYKNYINSFISQNFQGILKVERICKKCQVKKFHFERFHFINFNLNSIGNQKYVNISDLFIYTNKTKTNLGINQYIFCKKCKTYTEHIEQKTIYNIKNNLIIMFNRGKNNGNKIRIDFDETLLLNESHVKNISQRKYELLGIIIENNNIFYSIIKHNNNRWTLHNDKEYKEQYINFNDLKNIGNIICLFYYFDKAKSLFSEVGPKENNNKFNDNEFLQETNIVSNKLNNININNNEENKMDNIKQNNNIIPNNIYSNNLNNNMNSFNHKNNDMNRFNNMNVLNSNLNNNNRIVVNNNNMNNNGFNNKNVNHEMNRLNIQNNYNLNNMNNNYNVNNIFGLNGNFDFNTFGNNVGNGINKNMIGGIGNCMNNSMNNINNINSINNMNGNNNMNSINNINNMNNFNNMNKINIMNNINNKNNMNNIKNMNGINNMNMNINNSNMNNMNNFNNMNCINNMNGINNMNNFNNINYMNNRNIMNNINNNMNYFNNRKNFNNINNINNMNNYFPNQNQWNNNRNINL